MFIWPTSIKALFWNLLCLREIKLGNPSLHCCLSSRAKLEVTLGEGGEPSPSLSSSISCYFVQTSVESGYWALFKFLSPPPPPPYFRKSGCTTVVWPALVGKTLQWMLQMMHPDSVTDAKCSMLRAKWNEFILRKTYIHNASLSELLIVGHIRSLILQNAVLWSKS